jgi:MOSC domain-containing protein YiiM
MSGFAENGFVGRRLQIGTKAVIAVTDRDPRRKMITLDPNPSQASPEVLRRVRDSHEGKAGVYGAVLAEGTVRPGDEIRPLD